MRFENGAIIKSKGQPMTKSDDFILVDIDGNSLEKGKKPSGMAKVHLEILKTRKDINCVIHWGGGGYTDIIANLFDEIPMIPESIYVIQSKIPVVKLPEKGFSSLNELISWELKNVGELLTGSSKYNSYLVRFIGNWTIAKDLESAFLRVKVIENSAKTIFFKKLLGFSPDQLGAPKWLNDLVYSDLKLLNN